LGVSPKIPDILTSSEIQCIPDEIDKGDSPRVKLSLNSTRELSAIKTSLTPKHANLIESEADILQTLNHSLVLQTSARYLLGHAIVIQQCD
jgi:hypothetical protein